MASEQEQLWELIKNLSKKMANANDKSEREELQRRLNLANARWNEIKGGK